MSFGQRGGQPPAEQDWICTLCKEQNYPKVTTCFKCKTGRQAGAQEVAPRVFGKPPSVGSTLEGMVKSYNKKGFGFIMCLGGYTQDIFFTRENVSSRLLHPDMPGEQVSFEVAREQGKLVAKNVRALGEEIRMGERFGQYGGLKGKGRGSGEEDGSWICPMCKEHNFSRRSECFKCKLPKPGAPPQQGFGGQGFGGQGFGGQGFGQAPASAPPRVPGQPRFAFSDAPPPAGGAGPSEPQRNVSPHAGARAIREQLMRQRGEGGAQGAPGSPSDSSDEEKKESKKRKKSSSSNSSSGSSKKKKKKDKKKKKKKRKKRSSSSSASRSKSSSVELEVPEKGEASGSAPAAPNPEIEKAKSEAIARLQELKSIEPKEERMKRFRALLREWHPDKNLERSGVAKEVFQFLQKGKALME